MKLYFLVYGNEYGITDMNNNLIEDYDSIKKLFNKYDCEEEYQSIAIYEIDIVNKELNLKDLKIPEF